MSLCECPKLGPDGKYRCHYQPGAPGIDDPTCVYCPSNPQKCKALKEIKKRPGGGSCAHPNEAPVQNQKNFQWYCPMGDLNSLGSNSSGEVICVFNPLKCSTSAAIKANREVSRKNTNFKLYISVDTGDNAIWGFHQASNIKK